MGPSGPSDSVVDNFHASVALAPTQNNAWSPLVDGIKKISHRRPGNHQLVYPGRHGAWNHLLFWKADGRALIKKDKQMLSGEFCLPIGDGGADVPFVLMMKPKQSYLAKGGGALQKGKTSCAIDLSCKCDSLLPKDCSTLEFCLSVGSKNLDKLQPQRGPFSHDFLQRMGTNLDTEKWNVASAVDDDKEFIVALEVLNLQSHGNKEVLPPFSAGIRGDMASEEAKGSPRTLNLNVRDAL